MKRKHAGVTRFIGPTAHLGAGSTEFFRKRFPVVSRAGGLPFGVSFGLFGNAVLLPATKLTPPAHEFPMSSQVRGLVSHYVYAATAEGVCELIEGVERTIAPPQLRTNPELRRVS